MSILWFHTLISGAGSRWMGLCNAQLPIVCFIILLDNICFCMEHRGSACRRHNQKRQVSEIKAGQALAHYYHRAVCIELDVQVIQRVKVALDIISSI